MKGKRIIKTVFLLLSAWIVGMMCSCQGAEKTKTILLPEKGRLDSGAINVRNIREYSYEGNSAEKQIALNNKGNLCLLIQPEEGYLFQEIDLSAKNVLHEIAIKDSSIANIQIAPGGRYISYEVIENEYQQLVVLSVEDENKEVLYHWKNLDTLYMYKWSGNGASLFSWEDGLNYEQNASPEWSVSRYDFEDGRLAGKHQVLMEGNGYAWRKILPNQDASQIFVREEYREGGEANWLFDADMGYYSLDNISPEINWPVKFSQKGLYVADTEGNLCLITNFTGSQQKTIMPFNCMALEICEKGDHIFFVEEDSSGKLQLCGLKLQNGILSEKQILYKNMDAETVDMVISPADTAVLVQYGKCLEDDLYLFTFMELEY